MTRASFGACAASPNDRRATNTAVIVFLSLLWFSHVEFPGVDLRVDPEPVERRFLDGVGADRAAEPEGELHAVDVAGVGEVAAGLPGRPRRTPTPPGPPPPYSPPRAPPRPAPPPPAPRR